MQSFEIGLSGLGAARKALDVIGNNIANAATEGYHRQRVQLAPSDPTFDGRISWGTGVQTMGVDRAIDALLEGEIVHETSLSSHIDQELTTLKTVESTFSEFAAGGGLSQSINQFFNALQDLAAHPLEVTWQRQFVTAAQALSNHFQLIGTSLKDMADRVVMEIDEAVNQVNELATAIAELNHKIQKSEIAGSKANNLRDQRDKQISDLSKLISVDTRQGEYGMIDVTAGGIAVVMGSDAVEVQSGNIDANTIGFGVQGTSTYRRTEGGKLGGLFSVHNDILGGIQDQLDTLAVGIIHQINTYHCQGVGSAGSFTALNGWSVDSDAPLDSLDLGMTDGTVYIRVTNTNTGEVSRVEIDVDASSDTLESIAIKIAAATGLDASVLSNRLHIEAEPGYKFDFLPVPLPEPDDTDFAAPADAPSITVSGIYTGDANDVLTFTVQDGGSIGNGDWSITVTNQDGDTVTTLDAGSGYVAGDLIDLGNGIKVGLGVGVLGDDDEFTVKAFAETDTGGLLAAVGINTFFSGNSAQSMDVLSAFEDSPGLVATALGSDCSDNVNITRMAAIKDNALSDLSNRTVGDYYNTLVTTIGQDITTKQMRQENIQSMLQNLQARRSEVSGIDINDEAAQILMYEQMYQAMAKFLNSVRTATDTLLSLL